ncbi:Uncharacterized protein SCF082_LOCUS32239 [Durusdinium trenchii]|uniref:Uncharacterized protein n=1 Tax=Durusdinium trenchii TaxID=1381693 RepID=A0ABP0NCS2_9DINO
MASFLHQQGNRLLEFHEEDIDICAAAGQQDGVRYNNLGGHGPGHLDEPHMLRFEDVAVTAQGHPVDVVLRTTSAYHPQQPELNGRMGGHGATVNVRNPGRPTQPPGTECEKRRRFFGVRGLKHFPLTMEEKRKLFAEDLGIRFWPSFSVPVEVPLRDDDWPKSTVAVGTSVSLEILLVKPKVRYNNLGGHGPGHLDEPHMLRFEDVAVTAQGHPVDVVLRTTSAYHPQQPELNGRMGGHGATVNVAVGTSVSLEILLVKPKASHDLEPVDVEALLVSVYDVEEPFQSLATDGELGIGGFQALLWPNGTSELAVDLPKEHGVWATPAGVAPTFFFHRPSAIEMQLHARAATGSALGSLVAGRTFFITLRSPDLKAPPPRTPHSPHSPRRQTVALARRTLTPSPGRQSNAVYDLEAFWPSNFGTKMMLSHRNVMYNNLGGHGPVFSDPPVIRYRGACFHHGRPVDVVLHADSSYHPAASGLNALLGHHYSASVNVALNGTVHLTLELRSQQKPLPLPRLYVSVADSEEKPKLSGAHEVAAPGFEAAQLPSGTWSSAAQLGEDWSAPVSATPAIFTFWNTATVRLTLRAVVKPGGS